MNWPSVPGKVRPVLWFCLFCFALFLFLHSRLPCAVTLWQHLRVTGLVIPKEYAAFRATSCFSVGLIVYFSHRPLLLQTLVCWEVLAWFVFPSSSVRTAGGPTALVLTLQLEAFLQDSQGHVAVLPCVLQTCCLCFKYKILGVKNKHILFCSQK